MNAMFLRAKGHAEKCTQGRNRKLCSENELFLVLVRLRPGLFEGDMAHIFCVTQWAVSRIRTSWINFLYVQLCSLLLWALREIIDTTVPVAFAENYASRGVILDTTKIKCEVPFFCRFSRAHIRRTNLRTRSKVLQEYRQFRLLALCQNCSQNPS